MAIENELKFDGGVPSGKLNVPPKSCIPSRAKMRMKRKRRSRREMMDFIELSSDITKLRREDQYLEKRRNQVWSYLFYSILLNFYNQGSVQKSAFLTKAQSRFVIVVLTLRTCALSCSTHLRR